ncbi:hypothetical protein PGIGA_G00158700 [Pangasianodon gigas]|uniref:Uncharacterized protein n=1 Tax=Pangasianodon gigas TaxID=30993 RepID=A0ACC5XQH2_PANGG|nr:hypothetical protein [Pangasianodon gigas]
MWQRLSGTDTWRRDILFYFENGKTLIGISCLPGSPMMCLGALKICSQFGHNVVYQVQSTGLVLDNTLSNTRLVPDLV